MKTVKIILITLVLSLLAWISYVTYPRTHTEAVQSTPVLKPITIYELHELVNTERVKAGLQPLILDDRLNQSALLKVQELDREGWDDTPHVNDDGKRGIGYIFQTMPECKYGSENLLVNTVEAKIGVDWWMNSTAHREAMLSDKYSRVGYAVLNGYVAQHLC